MKRSIEISDIMCLRGNPLSALFEDDVSAKEQQGTAVQTCEGLM
ncbi:hypothetical protein [Planktotalea arctica]